MSAGEIPGGCEQKDLPGGKIFFVFCSFTTNVFNCTSENQISMLPRHPQHSGPTSLKYGFTNSPLSATNQSSPMVSISIFNSSFISSGRASMKSFFNVAVSLEGDEVDATGMERFARSDAGIVGSVGFGPTVGSIKN